MLSQQNLKRSYILQPQNKGLFHHIMSKIERVPYFAAAKFEIVSCMSGQNLKRSHILQPQNLRPFLNVRTKIEMVGQKLKQSHILHL